MLRYIRVVKPLRMATSSKIICCTGSQLCRQSYYPICIGVLFQDRRNFVRAPPAGVDFDFDYDKMYPVAVAIMGEDPNLEKMRFDLVPKV